MDKKAASLQCSGKHKVTKFSYNSKAKDDRGNLKVIVCCGEAPRIGEDMVSNNSSLTFTALMQNYSMAVRDGDIRPCGTWRRAGTLLQAFNVKMTPCLL